jgi:thymidylate synthase
MGIIEQEKSKQRPLFKKRDSTMKQYLDLAQRIIDEGTWIANSRTGKRCLTLINADLTYDVAGNKFPIITTRKSYWKAAIAELLGYIRGYDNAAQFRALGTKTWDANANENAVWLASPVRKGADDMGRVYGVQGRAWLKPDGGTIDQLQKIVDNLSKGVDDRGEILSFYNPGEFDLGCLRPCMHTHTFSLLNDTLYLTSYQRSCDVPLGLNFNQIQVFTLLALMAQITGHKPGLAYHKIVNAHIYEDQLPLMRDVQLTREPFESPSLMINPDIKSLKDLETWVTMDDFEIQGYKHHDPIQYPFSV